MIIDYFLYLKPIHFLTSPSSDLAVWSKTSEDIQRSLFSHFFDLLSHTRSVLP